MNPTINEQIAHVLKTTATANSRHLIDLWHPGLETQANVSSKDGKPVEGKTGVYRDKVGNEWYPIRTWNDETWRDRPLNFPLFKHVTAIGTTWWNGRDKLSEAVAFDFDGITGHAPGVGVSEKDLEKIKGLLMLIPWLKIYGSTGGSGIHAMARFKGGIPTENHNVHAALGRCVMAMMSEAVGFDFSAPVDQVAGNMWIYHALKQSDEKGSFKLIKEAEQEFTVDMLPPNWRDHIEVVSGRRQKIKVSGIVEGEYGEFEALCSGRPLVQISDKQRAIIDALGKAGYTTTWNPDLHLLQTHTCAWQKLYDDTDLREQLGLKGIFKTNSRGNNPGEPNCFAFPDYDDRFVIVRYGKGVNEHPMWEQAQGEWTRIVVNKSVDMKRAAMANEAAPLPNSKGFAFGTAEKMVGALAAMGSEVEIDAALTNREAEILKQKDGTYTARIKREGDEKAPAGWAVARGGWLERCLTIRQEVTQEPLQIDIDNHIRNVKTPTNQQYAWMCVQRDGSWYNVKKGDCVSVLRADGLARDDAEVQLGHCLKNPWLYTSVPFGPEYPGKRQWNLDAPQFAVQPAARSENIQHPTWDLMLQHLGSFMDADIQASEKMKDIGIFSGFEYLRAWCACLFRDPFAPLPYLFLYSRVESLGKSVLHESLGSLLTKGYVDAARVLENKSEFNGELAGAILCYVEEKNIARVNGALERIKKWVTSPILDIRKMRTDTFQVPNSTHWIQASNDPSTCPVFQGDTRITVIEVGPFAHTPIPKAEFVARIMEERAAFLRTLLDLELPPIVDRLRIPALDGKIKQHLQDSNRDSLTAFLQDHCRHMPGAEMGYNDFFPAFAEFVGPAEASQWNTKRIGLLWPDTQYARVRRGGKVYIQNLAFI